ncbi:MAG: hypothetical protein K5978_02715 [Campylobacter sp.]|nr:hypothetical protein [Campylobacter sp.]
MFKISKVALASLVLASGLYGHSRVVIVIDPFFGMYGAFHPRPRPYFSHRYHRPFYLPHRPHRHWGDRRKFGRNDRHFDQPKHKPKTFSREKR